jgi:hypothetical protein
MSCQKPLNSARRLKEACGFVDNASALPQTHRPQQQQKNRTFDVLQNADIFTRYRQADILEGA